MKYGGEDVGPQVPTEKPRLARGTTPVVGKDGSPSKAAPSPKAVRKGSDAPFDVIDRLDMSGLYGGGCE